MTSDRLASLAAEVAPEVLAEALAEARTRAREELAGRLQQAIVDAACRDTTISAAGAERLASDEPAGRVHREPPGSAGTGLRDSAATDLRDSAGKEPREPAAAAEPRDSSDASSERGLYAFGITRAGPLDLADVTGMGSSPPQVIASGDLGLVVSEVPLSLLQDVAEDDLSEDGQLATLVRRHDAVVRAIFDRVPVLPLRFGTVVPDAVAARSLLSDTHDLALRRLDGLVAQREWGVRVSRPTRPVTAARTASDDESGTAYLSRRRRELSRAEAEEERARALADRVEEVLSRQASDVVRLSSRSPGVLLEVACLVPVATEKEFHDAVARLEAELATDGAGVETTGPWPPYSFATLDTREVRGA